MSDELSTLFDDFDRGRLSRRQLLIALGLAAAIRPASALAQGQCGGARASLPECNATPAQLPFERTGWKTAVLDHFSCQAADYQKEAAFYQALMNWKIVADDGKQAVLDIGGWGGLVIRGGYQAPPAPPTPPPDQAAGGRGGGRGGPRPPRNAVFDGFCWGIEPWDAKKVEAELKKRGLAPVADNHGDFQSFHVKDPGGFDLQISNASAKNRRLPKGDVKSSAAAPFAPTAWKTIWLDHISFEVPSYKDSVAFYDALLGWKPTKDEGSQNQVEIGEIGDAIIRRGGGRGGGAPRTAGIGHIAFGITPFDPDAVKAELEKRGLNAREDTGGRGDIHSASYKSYHTTTPNGFDLQISATTRANRNPLG